MVLCFYFVFMFFLLIVFVDIFVFLSGERSAFFYILLSTIVLVILVKDYKLIRLLTIILSITSIYFITYYDTSIKNRMINNTIEQFNLLNDSGNKVSKTNLSLLSLNNNLTNKAIYIYPNPVTNFIKVSGLKQAKNFRIYNMIGAKILEGVINNNKSIKVQNLSKGIYFLNFDKSTLKFIKN